MSGPSTHMLAPPPTSQAPGGALTLEMAIREYAHELPGMLFHAYRLRVAISRAPKVKKAA